MDEGRVKLSIIVPVYNMAADGMLEYCLDSLVFQTYRNFEIIAVDDASTDDSFRILKEYEKRYPQFFRAFHLVKNMRQGAAKNRGLEAAQGKYIGFVDSDDWIHPDMFARLMRLAEMTGADVVGCDYCLTDRHSLEPGPCCHNNREEQAGKLDARRRRSLILEPGSLVVKIYARELFERPKLRFPERIFYEDNGLSALLMLRARHFEYIDEPLYYYYQHGGSTVHTVSEERCYDRMQAMEFMLEGIREENLKAFRPEIEYRFASLFYINTLFSYMQGDQKKEFQFVKQLGKRMKEAFPDFQRNPYYLEKVDAEGQKMVKIQQISTLLFLVYYQALHKVREMRSEENTNP